MINGRCFKCNNPRTSGMDCFWCEDKVDPQIAELGGELSVDQGKPSWMGTIRDLEKELDFLEAENERARLECEDRKYFMNVFATDNANLVRDRDAIMDHAEESDMKVSLLRDALERLRPPINSASAHRIIDQTLDLTK